MTVALVLTVCMLSLRAVHQPSPRSMSMLHGSIIGRTMTVAWLKLVPVYTGKERSGRVNFTSLPPHPPRPKYFKSMTNYTSNRILCFISCACADVYNVTVQQNIDNIEKLGSFCLAGS